MPKIELDFTDEDAEALRSALQNKWGALPEAELAQLIRAEAWRAATEQRIAEANGQEPEADVIQEAITRANKRWGGIG